jgi:hypothetical protein
LLSFTVLRAVLFTQFVRLFPGAFLWLSSFAAVVFTPSTVEGLVCRLIWLVIVIFSMGR